MLSPDIIYHLPFLETHRVAEEVKTQQVQITVANTKPPTQQQTPLKKWKMVDTRWARA
jgi:hypothetical protein